MQKPPIILLLILASFILLSGCPGQGPAPQPNSTNSTNSTLPQNYTCPDGTTAQSPSACEANLCPSSCDDANSCTIDSCGKDTEYECKHAAKIPCCGDGACESGETASSCTIDCGACPLDCYDGNPCTRDSCSRATGFNCSHEGITGSAIGCSGYPSFSGYSSVKYRFGISPPDDWEVDELTKALDGGVLFTGPSARQNCSEPAILEKGVYTDLAYEFMITPPRGWGVIRSGGVSFLDTNTSQQEEIGAWWVSESRYSVIEAYGGSDAVIYVNTSPTGESDVESYVGTVRGALAKAKAISSEITDMGITIGNISSIKESKGRIAGLSAHEFMIAAQSNRSGEWKDELQRRVYLLANGNAYELTLTARPDAFQAPNSDFDTALASFKPISAYACNSTGYPVSIGVFSGPANPAYLLKDYVQASLLSQGGTAPYVLLGTGDLLLDGNAGKYYAISTQDGGFPVKKEVVISYKGGTAYVLEFTALRGDFEKEGPAFDSAVKSFRILPASGGCKQQSCIQGACAIETLPDCCGNGVCDGSESCSSCPGDCGSCGSAYPELDAVQIFPGTAPKYYTSFNCENYLIRVRISNPLNEPLTVNSSDALRLVSASDSTCRVGARSTLDCIATMSGAFGDAYTNGTAERALTLIAYTGTSQDRGQQFAAVIRHNVTYSIPWIGPNCMQFYCIPGTKIAVENKPYAITGISSYRGESLIGNWWCHANYTSLSQDGKITGFADYYFQKFYNASCLVKWSPTWVKQSEKCQST